MRPMAIFCAPRRNRRRRHRSESCRGSLQSFIDYLLSPAAGKLQDEIPARYREKLQTATRRFALHFRVEHLHRRLVNLQVTARLHFRSHRSVDRPQPLGDMLDRLRYLLTPDLHAVTFGKCTFQAVKREAIIIARQDDVHRQGQAQLALRIQARGQRCNSHAPMATTVGVHDAREPARILAAAWGSLRTESSWSCEFAQQDE